MVQVTNDEIDINKDYAIDHAVIGDAKLVLQQLLEEVRARTKGSSREGRRRGQRGGGGQGAVAGELDAAVQLQRGSDQPSSAWSGT